MATADWPAAVEGEPRSATLSRVHAWALNHFIWVDDRFTHGVPEHWPAHQEIESQLRERGEVWDDCDGFTVMCRYALKRLGIRSRLVLCRVENGGYHAVCEADGSVLDNRQVTVCSTQDLEIVGYRWDRMSGYEPGDPWTLALRSA